LKFSVFQNFRWDARLATTRCDFNCPVQKNGSCGSSQ